jgi:hypothetical protein
MKMDMTPSVLASEQGGVYLILCWSMQYFVVQVVGYIGQRSCEEVTSHSHLHPHTHRLHLLQKGCLGECPGRDDALLPTQEPDLGQPDGALLLLSPPR